MPSPSTSRHDRPSDASSSSAAAASSSSHNRIEFYIGNHLLPYDMTVYQVRKNLDIFRRFRSLKDMYITKDNQITSRLFQY